MGLSKILYKAGFKYQTAETYSITLRFDCPDFNIDPYIRLNANKLTIHGGYAWDGPSGPTIDTKSFMRGSLVHDVLYEAMRKGFLSKNFRYPADKLLRDMCIEDGMWRWRAAWVYAAVRKAGGPSANPANRKRIHKAP